MTGLTSQSLFNSLLQAAADSTRELSFKKHKNQGEMIEISQSEQVSDLRQAWRSSSPDVTSGGKAW